MIAPNGGSFLPSSGERREVPSFEGGERARTLARVRLRAEIALARAAGRLSRLAGRGGGTTIPGKILATVDPAAVGKLARRLPLGSALVHFKGDFEQRIAPQGTAVHG